MWTFTPSTLAAYFSEDGFFYHEDDTKVWLKMETGRWKLLCSKPAGTILGRGAGEYVFLVHPLTQTIMAYFGRLGRALVMRQPTDAFGRLSCPLCTRSSHLESGALFPLSLYLADSVIVLGVWVLVRSTENGFFSGDVCFRGCSAWFDSGYMLCVSTLVALDVFHTIFPRCGGLES